MTENNICICGKFRDGFCICTPANDNDDVGIVFLPSSKKLQQPWVQHRLAICFKNLIPISRRKILHHMSDVIWNFDGIIVSQHGKRLDPLTIDVFEVLGEDNDPGMRKWSDFLGWAERMPLQRPQERVIERLRIAFLVIAIKHPAVARKIL